MHGKKYPIAFSVPVGGFVGCWHGSDSPHPNKYFLLNPKVIVVLSHPPSGQKEDE